MSSTKYFGKLFQRKGECSIWDTLLKNSIGVRKLREPRKERKM